MSTPISQAMLSSLGPSARPPFVAAKVFLDATFAGDWTNQGLHEWFDRHLVSAGYMPLPIAVSEPGAGTIPLHGAGAEEQNPRFTALLGAARAEILATLRGLVATPVDDSFLASVIYAGRVRRKRLANGTAWTPNPEPSAPLSAVVLSLLAADILAYRAFYDEQLSICDLCDRVSFEEGAAARRRRCAEHAHPASGFFPAGARDGEESGYSDDEVTLKRG